MRFMLLRSFLLSLFLLLGGSTVLAQEAKTYEVKAGDTLYRIAQNHNTTVEEIRRLNDLEGNIIQPGQVLVVGAGAVVEEVAPELEPVADVDAPEPEPEYPEDQLEEEEWPDKEAAFSRIVPREKRPYLVQQGDTYYSIALDLDVPAYAIYALNEGRTDALKHMEEIWIPDISKRPRAGVQNGPRGYVVRKGDTLFSIARREGSTVEEIRAANGLPGTGLREGQVLVIPDKKDKETTTERTVPPLYEVGPVDIYPDTFAGRVMESGRPYDPERFTVSHPDLPLETIVLLTNPETEFSTFAEVSDRGPQDERFVMDVSAAVGQELGLIRGVMQQIQIRVVE